MDEQHAFSRLLHSSGHGIALRHPTQEIEVGDVCYWDADGTATRIFNVFDNAEVLTVVPGSSITVVAQGEQVADAGLNKRASGHRHVRIQQHPHHPRRRVLVGSCSGQVSAL